MEVEKAESFLKDWVGEGDNRYIVIVTKDKEVIYKPTKSTKRLDTIFVKNLTQQDIRKIKTEIKGLKLIIPIKHCLHYYFDERQDPRFIKKK